MKRDPYRQRDPFEDWPLFSTRRLFEAVRHWLWAVAVEGVDLPFWNHIRYHLRPEEADRKGVY